MSYEYFLQAHSKQSSQEISTASILSIFEDYIIAKDDTYIDLQFDEENKCSIYIDTRNSTVSHIMVTRPSRLQRFESKSIGVFTYFPIACCNQETILQNGDYNIGSKLFCGKYVVEGVKILMTSDVAIVEID